MHPSWQNINLQVLSHARGLISGRFLLTHSRTHSHHYCTSAGLQLQGACTLCQYRDIHALFTVELR